jgi:arsenical-resistance protein 2
MAETQTPKTENWWDAFPAPRAKCPEMTADELMKAFDDMDLTPEPRSFLLVDVRRNDWEVCDHSNHEYMGILQEGDGLLLDCV